MNSRRDFIGSLARTAAVFSFDQIAGALASPLPVQFVNVAREAGLHRKTTFGGEKRNTFLLETTGCGAAFFDFDHDGWLDIFLVNGTTFEGKYAPGQEPVCRLYKNNRDGTFTDITLKSGIARTGWGQGCCVGDYDNNGWDDLFVTYWGECALFHNNGNGTSLTLRGRQALPPLSPAGGVGTPVARSLTMIATAISISL